MRQQAFMTTAKAVVFAHICYKTWVKMPNNLMHSQVYIYFYTGKYDVWPEKSKVPAG